MPPNKFKTQVLLLHSEQSTLENLSAGFSDLYTVHCATSGSEALSTLGDTPIDVIVSAQNLPGMSGLEALREAKKRSPDTIGILIDEDTKEGLEAVVGNEELFQVVRGNVSRETILDLVDDATKQLRLMTLSVSANDNAAADENADGEHIVMETTQDGLTVVTDSSGRVPILDPQRVSETADSRSQSVDLLVLTRDSDFLETIKDSCRTAHTVHYASTLAQADQTIRQFPVGVAVIDAGMIGSKIEQLTEYLRRGEPRLVPIVAGRRDDGEMLMDLINRGKVYRFLLKPVSPGRARLAIESSAKFHVDAPDAAFARQAAETPGAARAAQHSPASPQQAGAFNDATATGSQINAANEPAVDESVDEALGGNERNFTSTISGFFDTLGGKAVASETVDGSETVETDDEPANDDARGPSGRKSIAAVAGIATIAVVAGAYFWLGNGSFDDTAIERPAPSEQTVTTPPEAREPVFVEEVSEDAADGPLVTETAAAVESASLESPLEDAAAAVPQAADDETSVTDVLTMVESALLDSRLDDAAAALQQAATADPDNVRIPFLDAQLSQARLQQHFQEAQSAISEARFADAESALAAARAMTPTGSAQVELLEKELAAARNVELAAEAVATANSRLQSGALLLPADDSARHFFDLALAADPDNAAARQGLGVIAGKLAADAKSEINQGRLGAAEKLLATARTLDPGNAEVTAAAATLSSRREAVAAKRAEEAVIRRRTVAASRPAVEPPSQAATEAVAEKAGRDDPSSVDGAAVAQPTPTAGDAATEDAEDIADMAAATTTTPVATGATAAAGGAPGTAEPDLAPDEDTAAQVPLAMISSLSRTKYVAPRYPRGAERRNLSGFVDVVFTVATDGTVKDVGVQKSEPDDTFVASATKAVAKWQFEPVVENGVAVERRVGVRLMFALE